jgi:hypothetical protein
MVLAGLEQIHDKFFVKSPYSGPSSIACQDVCKKQPAAEGGVMRNNDERDSADEQSAGSSATSNADCGRALFDEVANSMLRPEQQKVNADQPRIEGVPNPVPKQKPENAPRSEDDPEPPPRKPADKYKGTDPRNDQNRTDRKDNKDGKDLKQKRDEDDPEPPKKTKSKSRDTVPPDVPPAIPPGKVPPPFNPGPNQKEEKKEFDPLPGIPNPKGQGLKPPTSPQPQKPGETAKAKDYLPVVELV